MNYANRLALGTSFFVFLVSSSPGQTTSTASLPAAASLPQPRVICSASLQPTTRMAYSGTAAPYSAEREVSEIQTLADGTHITHRPRSEKHFRDSQVRTRTERTFCHGPSEDMSAVIIEINDPVAGYSYLLDTQNQVAHRYVLEVLQHGALPSSTTTTSTLSIAPATGSGASSSVVSRPAPVPRALSSEPDRPHPTFTSEPLGTQVIEGVLAEGTKTTEVIPVGLEGNDGPITVVTERWYSSELKLNILTKRSDPRSGEMTERLFNISRTEPDPLLFRPPADYKVVDETAPVRLTFTRQ